MTSPPLYLGLDLGTSSTKIVAWDASGTAVATGQSPVTTSTPAAGFAEQQADDWWTSLCLAARACLEHCDAAAVAGIGVSVQRETFVLLDLAGMPLRPAVLWYDERGSEYLPALSMALGADEYLSATGKQLDVTAVAAKLRWFAEHEPETLLDTAAFADVMAYVSLRLTDELATTWAGADTTGLIGLQTRDWHPPHLAAAGLRREQMPALVGAGGRLGVLSKSAAMALGLGAGLPVVAGGGDGHCFALGAGRGRTHAATLTLGTSACLALPMADAVLSPYGRTLLACPPTAYLVETVVQCGSATLAWLHERFLPGGVGVASYDHFEAACADLPPGAEGLLVVPHWRGARAPYNDADARGVVVGWTDRHTAAHLQRAIMEGVALEVARVLGLLQREHGLAVEQLVVGGGGAVSDCWCGILAAVAHVPVTRPASVESSSFGAALAAMSAARGVSPADCLAAIDAAEDAFVPDAAAGAVYDRLQDLQHQLYECTRGISHAMAALA